jgi:hypothetical protein
MPSSPASGFRFRSPLLTQLRRRFANSYIRRMLSAIRRGVMSRFPSYPPSLGVDAPFLDDAASSLGEIVFENREKVVFEDRRSGLPELPSAELPEPSFLPSEDSVFYGPSEENSDAASERDERDLASDSASLFSLSATESSLSLSSAGESSFSLSSAGESSFSLSSAGESSLSLSSAGESHVSGSAGEGIGNLPELPDFGLASWGRDTLAATLARGNDVAVEHDSPQGRREVIQRHLEDRRKGRVVLGNESSQERD